LGSRRRDRTSWEGTGVAEVFAHSDEKHLLRIRDLILRVRCAVARVCSSRFCTSWWLLLIDMDLIGTLYRIMQHCCQRSQYLTPTRMDGSLKAI
jgi:hypothetical protein